MKFYIIAFLVLLGFDIYSQDDFSKQYSLIKEGIQKPFETLRRHTENAANESQFSDSFFIDHIIKKYSSRDNLSRFISNRFFLEKFTPKVLNMNSAILCLDNEKKIKINISKKISLKNELINVTYDSTTYKGKTLNSYRYIESINSKKVYGILFDTSEVAQIQSISITIDNKVYLVDKSSFEDLYFPNFCEIEYATKPIEVYLSPNKKFIYIYIFGGQEAAKYFTKIIFDLEKQITTGRMISENLELMSYQCLYPSNFIGF